MIRGVVRCSQGEGMYIEKRNLIVSYNLKTFVITTIGTPTISLVLAIQPIMHHDV